MASNTRRRITSHRLHSWAGIVAAAWLLVLAVTGLMQLNRGSWSWQWSGGLALDERMAERDDKQLWRHHQLDPGQPLRRVVSGAAGAWLTEDGGKRWHRLTFGAGVVRNVAALETVGSGDDWAVFAGTDDGAWHLDVAQRRFVPIGLQGQSVNSLAIDETRIVAAVRMSQLFTLSRAGMGTGRGAADAGGWQPLALGPLPAADAPPHVDLGRFLQDLHVARGLFGGPFDQWLWNLSAVGLLLLCLTGVLHWSIKEWTSRSRQRAVERKPSPAAMRRVFDLLRWCFRAHAMVLGIVLALPLLLIFVTGFYQDHRTDVQQLFRTLHVPAFLLTPSYRGDGWRGQVNNVALARDDRGPLLAIGNRRGMFTSRDDGASWRRESGFLGPAMRLRNVGGELFVPGRMMRRVQVRRAGEWTPLRVPPPVVMVNEMSAGPGGTLWWTRGDTIFITSSAGQMRGKAANALPRLGYVPWATIASRVHDGALISVHWKWVNDVVALLGVLLVVTGVMRWFQRRW